MFNRTILGATFLLVLGSLAQAQGRCEFKFRGPRDMPACTLKQQGAQIRIDPQAREAIARIRHPYLPTQPLQTPSANLLLDEFHGNTKE